MVSIIYGPEAEIDSVSGYIEQISKRPQNNVPDNVELKFYYRGHSNVDYRLSPSIARYKYGIGVETALIKAANHKLPREFDVKMGVLPMLAKMQHYGLPTRLIDFTTNPLVALYFACQNEQTDGEIIETYEII